MLFQFGSRVEKKSEASIQDIVKQEEEAGDSHVIKDPQAGE
jgi:hypothetical protein